MSDWGLSDLMINLLGAILKLENEATRDRSFGHYGSYPDIVLRNTAEDREVLKRHAMVDCLDDRWWCETCELHWDGPHCPEILSIARRYGIMTP